jgi:hypothetical protein
LLLLKEDALLLSHDAMEMVDVPKFRPAALMPLMLGVEWYEDYCF